MRSASFLILIMIFMSSSATAFETLAKQAIILDYHTKQILFEKDSQEKMPPSSMSKLMTLYVLFDEIKKGHLKLTDSFLVSQKAWKMTGSKMFLPVASQVSIEDLIRGIIVHSGNDACVVVAEGISGSEEEFARLLNKYAEKIGLQNSHFVNATGMPDPEHYMSAADIAHLSKHIIQDFQEYYSYFKEKSFTYNNITQANRNSLLEDKYHVDGLKTGHTDKGGYGVAISTNQNDRRLIIITNGLSSNNMRHEETLKLLQYGMLNFGMKEIAKKDAVFKEIPVKYGNEKIIRAGFFEDVRISALKNDLENIKQEYTINDNIQAPIKRGDEVGILTLSINDQHYEYKLLALEDVDRASWIKRKISDIRDIF